MCTELFLPVAVVFDILVLFCSFFALVLVNCDTGYVEEFISEECSMGLNLFNSFFGSLRYVRSSLIERDRNRV